MRLKIFTFITGGFESELVAVLRLESVVGLTLERVVGLRLELVADFIGIRSLNFQIKMIVILHEIFTTQRLSRCLP